MKINISTTTVVKNRSFKAGIKIKCNNIECYGYDDCYGVNKNESIKKNGKRITNKRGYQ